MIIETLGVDIAKNMFQLHGDNGNGRVVLHAGLAQIGPCTVAVEACAGAILMGA
jgi:hypothetical protein